MNNKIKEELNRIELNMYNLMQDFSIEDNNIIIKSDNFYKLMELREELERIAYTFN